MQAAVRRPPKRILRQRVGVPEEGIHRPAFLKDIQIRGKAFASKRKQNIKRKKEIFKRKKTHDKKITAMIDRVGDVNFTTSYLARRTKYGKARTTRTLKGTRKYPLAFADTKKADKCVSKCIRNQRRVAKVRGKKTVIGTREEVYKGIASKTKGGLTKVNIEKRGMRYISKKKVEQGKASGRLNLEKKK